MTDAEIAEYTQTARTQGWPFGKTGIAKARFIAEQAIAARCRETRTQAFLQACQPLLLCALTRIELDEEARNYLRPEVRRFALAMENKLRANDHKGGWQNDSWRDLYGRLLDEAEELAQAIEASETLSIETDILGEAADVANFALMLADVNEQLANPILAPATFAEEPTDDLAGSSLLVLDEEAYKRFSEEMENPKPLSEEMIEMARNRRIFKAPS